jgi:menaquinone-dependent protoporphyrinogen IX oxidase
MEKPLKEAVDFARHHRDALARIPVAVFSSGLFMREDTVENREKTRGFLTPLLELVPDPVSIAFFGGSLAYEKLNFLLRFAAKHDTSGMMREGDWRNWEEIRVWAGGLAGHFSRPV